MIKPDELWKTILEDFFEEFLHFFYPVEAQEVDWAFAPEFLDKELARLVPKSRAKGRIADKLVKVRLKNGRDRWILIHVEVQGYADDSFPVRMFQMRVRIRERFVGEVVAMAILTDDDPDFCPEYYEEKTWDNHLTYRWRSFKLLNNPPETFADRDNIFSTIMSIAYRRLKIGKLRDQDLLDFKLELIHELARKQMSEKKRDNLMTFIEYYVRFENQEYVHIFDQKLDELNQIEPNMSTYELKIQYLTKKARKEARIEGHQEGREEGREVGREEGRQEGRQEGLEMGIERLLIRGFAPEEVAIMFDMAPEKVIGIRERLVAAGKLDQK